MKFSRSIVPLCLLLRGCIPSFALRSGIRKPSLHDNKTPKNRLLSGPYDQFFITNCIGSSLAAGQSLSPGESICKSFSDGDAIYFEVNDGYENSPGELDYYLLVSKVSGGLSSTHNLMTATVPIGADPPKLKMNENGQLTFGDDVISNGCRAKAKWQGAELKIADTLPEFVEMLDTKGDVIWKLIEDEASSRLSKWSGECYPDDVDECVSVLPAEKGKNRLSWKQYICEYGPDGSTLYWFGLDHLGQLGLWQHIVDDDHLMWQPSDEIIQGDYVHLQLDGHLTFYAGNKTPVDYKWVSNCLDSAVRKMVISDGDVVIFNDSGAVIWTLQGSLFDGVGSVGPICHEGCT